LEEEQGYKLCLRERIDYNSRTYS